ncbi:LysE family transporter [Maridesulfovibrio sp.]|uniref:LysE family translocator n=1 Tax=Maridesulfovibrio sp. TaxID=2795000 RepID=UPI002A1898C5|nr:LysE family transporter [Maridesulfovibrio sp.]
MLESVLTLLTVCFLARMSPGPDMMLLIHHSGSGNSTSGSFFSGSRSAYGCVLGVCTGLAFHVSLSILGLALLLKSNHLLFEVLRYAGAMYLIYIGCRCLMDKSTTVLTDGEVCAPAATFGQGFRDGLFCNLLNPKVTLFILSVFMQLTGPDSGLTEKIVYGSVIVGEALVGWVLFLLFLNTPFMKRIYGCHASVLNKATGTILLLLGGAIFIYG